MMLNDSPPEFLTAILSCYDILPIPDHRPLVTLTFAQSLDAKIAGKNGKQLILSGEESMIMTHWMRTMHDAILIGIGTALNDDPQLNARHLPPPTDGSTRPLPRPVIVDSQLRLSPTCKLLVNYQNGRGRRPWVICPVIADAACHERLEKLEGSGAKVIQVPVEQGKQLTIREILLALRCQDIHTLMVEGGARIIESFLTETPNESTIDSFVLTTAPTLIGADGVGYAAQALDHVEMPTLRHIWTQMLGRDVIVGFTSHAGSPKV